MGPDDFPLLVHLEKPLLHQNIKVVFRVTVEAQTGEELSQIGIVPVRAASLEIQE
jgi:hypothetical protein